MAVGKSARKIGRRDGNSSGSRRDFVSPNSSAFRMITGFANADFTSVRPDHMKPTSTRPACLTSHLSLRDDTMGMLAGNHRRRGLQ